jgi:putative flippase GtrA
VKKGLKKLAGQFMRYGANAGVVLLVKLGGVAVLTRVMHASAAYALVHVLTVVVSYYLHTRLSFATERTWRGFFDFLKAVIGAKLLDYLVFNVAFVYLDIQALWSVAVASIAIFFFRFFMIRKALTPPEKAPEQDGAGAEPGKTPEARPSVPVGHG